MVNQPQFFFLAWEVTLHLFNFKGGRMSAERAGLSIQFALCIYEQDFNFDSEGSGGENWPLSSYRSLLALQPVLCSPQNQGKKKTNHKPLWKNVGSWIVLICFLELRLSEGHTQSQHCIESALYKYGFLSMFISCQNWFGINGKTIFPLLSLYTFPLNFPAAGPWDTTGKGFWVKAGERNLLGKYHSGWNTLHVPERSRALFHLTATKIEPCCRCWRLELFKKFYREQICVV